MNEKEKEAAHHSGEQPQITTHEKSISHLSNLATADPLVNEIQEEAKTLAFAETHGFPIDFFPERVLNFIKDTSKALSCPPDFVAMGVLVCASVAIGNGAALQLKKSWITGASLYCGIVAEPGSAKTPALSKAVQPLYDLQKENFVEYEGKLADYELEKGRYDKRLEQWKEGLVNEVGSDLNKPKPPQKPKLKQIVSVDSTMEALQEILLVNQRGILKSHDELLGFIKSLNQYRAGADRQYYLSMYSNETIVINRKAKDPIVIPKPYVSIIGGIQPEMIEELIKEGGEGVSKDGFIDRFLFCYPEPVPSNWTDDDVSDDVIEGYSDVIQKLYFSLDEKLPSIFEFEQKAKEAFTLWFNATEDQTGEAGFPDALKGIWRKLKGLHPRILLIMHLLECSDGNGEIKEGSIHEDTVVNTNYIMDYFKIQARKVFQITHSSYHEKRALKLMEYVRRKGKKNEQGLSIRINSLNRGKVFGRNTNINMIEETIDYILKQELGEVHQYTIKNGFIREFILYQKNV
ncbi:DUF3987 domain-containing protein [Fictibacillus sp. S7]|uniref:DUF3987 domain-containing protein n=1 Tax=Fictibacillus sp. S7 TaxID=2212476 RepID=UPI0010126681|nr:DUF3987 domain-containing protein [Fictibacillus sp. S7]RXZ00949.1 hypothetical protein DMO16_15565 [Fictibacillus sp. S7]